MYISGSRTKTIQPKFTKLYFQGFVQIQVQVPYIRAIIDLNTIFNNEKAYTVIFIIKYFLQLFSKHYI